jgi:hypothetical protein
MRKERLVKEEKSRPGNRGRDGAEVKPSGRGKAFLPLTLPLFTYSPVLLLLRFTKAGASTCLAQNGANDWSAELLPRQARRV